MRKSYWKPFYRILDHFWEIRKMSLSPQGWHKRFTQQARWTQDLRSYIYPIVGLAEADKILDLGCGTGALLGELQSQSGGRVFGLDIHSGNLRLARGLEGVLLTQGDAHQLSYPQDTFDITLCHFTLMWVTDPASVIAEMLRVTRPSGVVMALAEPDYGGRIDYPIELEQIGGWQTESLSAQGADPFMGRKMAGLFTRAGMGNIQTGVLGAQWMGAPSQNEIDIEWEVMRSDLKDKIPEELEVLDKTAYETGERVLFVPTFYAIGYKL
jgi:SAM-dependent methyltransferase